MTNHELARDLRRQADRTEAAHEHAGDEVDSLRLAADILDSGNFKVVLVGSPCRAGEGLLIAPGGAAGWAAALDGQ